MNRYVLKDLFKQKGVFPFVIMIIMSFLITSLLPYLNGMFIDSLTYKLEEKKIILFAIMIASIGLLWCLFIILCKHVYCKNSE